MDPQQQAVLNSIPGHAGWKVVGTRPHTTTVTGPPDAYGQPTKVEKPDGLLVWSIVSPTGQPDEIVVKPPSAPNVPYENAADPGAQPGASNYTVVEGPKNTPTKEAPPQVQGWADQFWYTNADGSKTLYGRDPKDGKFKQVPDVPAQAAGAGEKKPTPAGQLETINDPTTGKPIKLRDPQTGTVIDLPDAKPDKPQIIDGPGGAKYSWDGTNLKPVLAGTPQAQEGQTRQSVIPGTQYVGQEVYHNGTWSIDSSFTPKPYVPTDKPKEGDVRPNVIQGQSVQEVYRGGSWVVDTSVAPKPFVPQSPTTVSAPANQQYIVQQTPGQPGVQSIENPNYQASDVAGRVGQLKQQAQTKRDQLNAQVSSGQKTAEQAATEFDTWWSSNIDPVSQQLQQQQAQQTQDAQIKANQEQRAQQAAEQSAFTTAQTAGQNAASRAQALLPYMVGPGYGAAVNNIAGAFASGKSPQNLDIGSAVNFNAPDFNGIAEQATAQALAHLSPTAAGKVGAPMPQIPQGIDVKSALNKSQYQFGGTTTITPDGTVTIQHAQQQPQPAIPTMPTYVPNASQSGGLDYALPPQTF